MAVLVDSYSESNYSGSDWWFGETTQVAQSFNASIARNINSAKFYLRKVGTPTGNIVVKLYAHSGTYGTSSVPTGAALATSDAIVASSLSTSYALVPFTFSTPYSLVLNTKYVISCVYENGTETDLVQLGDDGDSPSHGGNECYYDGSWAYDAGYDVPFYVYVDDAAGGPANLKTWNGLAKASIKTINGLAIGSVKTINGLV